MRESNLTAWSVHFFAARPGRVYQVTYLEIARGNGSIEPSAAACWRTALERMVESFRAGN